MKLLAFETATEACSVALWIDGDVRERFELAPRRHAELALPWAQALLAEAGIGEIAARCDRRRPWTRRLHRRAPGDRDLAQGIALALDRPVVPVSTLAALGDAAPPATASWRRSMRAWARFTWARSSAWTTAGCPRSAKKPSSEPDPWCVPEGSWEGIGTGFAAAGKALSARLQGRLSSVDAQALPHAADVARLAARAYRARGSGCAGPHRTGLPAQRRRTDADAAARPLARITASEAFASAQTPWIGRERLTGRPACRPA